jgi:hypothetical protein
MPKGLLFFVIPALYSVIVGAAAPAADARSRAVIATPTTGRIRARTGTPRR